MILSKLSRDYVVDWTDPKTGQLKKCAIGPNGCGPWPTDPKLSRKVDEALDLLIAADAIDQHLVLDGREQIHLALASTNTLEKRRLDTLEREWAKSDLVVEAAATRESELALLQHTLQHHALELRSARYGALVDQAVAMRDDASDGAIIELNTRLADALRCVEGVRGGYVPRY